MLVGNAKILGGETKIILHDQGNQLKIMFEQYGTVNSPFVIDFSKGGQLFVNTTTGQVVLNSKNVECQYSQPGIIEIQKHDEKKIIFDVKTKTELQSSLEKIRIPFDISSIPENVIINKAEILYDKQSKK